MTSSSSLHAVDERSSARGRELNLALADRAQAAFHLVGQPLRFAQLDHRRDALQRMEAAEQLLDDGRRRIGTADGGLEHQQAAAHGGEVLLALGEVVVHERSREIDCCRSGVDTAYAFSDGLGRTRALRPADSLTDAARRRRQERLRHVRRRAGLQRRVAARRVAARRQHQHRHIAILVVRPDEPHHVEAVHVGHVEIEDDRVHFAQRKHFDRFQAGTGFANVASSAALKRRPDHPPNRRRIIDNQNRQP